MQKLWHALNAEVTGCAEERMPAMQGHTVSSRPSAASQRASSLACCWTTQPCQPISRQTAQRTPRRATTSSRCLWAQARLHALLCSSSVLQSLLLMLRYSACRHDFRGLCEQPIWNLLLDARLRPRMFRRKHRRGLLSTEPDSACHHLCSGESNAGQGRGAGHGSERLPGRRVGSHAVRCPSTCLSDADLTVTEISVRSQTWRPWQACACCGTSCRPVAALRPWPGGRED